MQKMHRQHNSATQSVLDRDTAHGGLKPTNEQFGLDFLIIGVSCFAAWLIMKSIARSLGRCWRGEDRA